MGMRGGDGYDEYMCPYYLFDNEISDDELSEWLDDLPTDNIVVWLDTCFSGGNLKSAGLTPKGISRTGVSIDTQNNGFMDDFTRKTRDVDDLTSPYISTAADDDEYSYEDSSIGHGVYSLYLIEAITNADTNFDNWVSAEETFTYLYSRVVAYESTQHPQEYDAFAGEALVVGEASANVPDVEITTPSSPVLRVDNSISTYDLAGTCNTSAVGSLVWSNNLSGLSGATAAGTNWSLNGLSLAEGENVILVTVTNSEGLTASDSVSITRAPAGQLLFEDFDDSTNVPSGWTDSGTANDTLPVHYSSGPNCRALTSGDTLDTPALSGATSLVFYADASNSGSGESVSVEYYNGSWQTLGTFVLSSSGSQESYTLPLASETDGKIRWNGPASGTFYLDDIMILGGEAVAGLSVSITSAPPASVAYETDTIDLSGLASTNAVGSLSWSNSLGGYGQVAVATNWQVSGISLAVGDNQITITVSNDIGETASALAGVTRQPEGGSLPTGQLAFQGFEGAVEDTWGYSGSGSVSTAYARTDTSGYRLIASQQVDFNEMDISGYTSVTVTLHTTTWGIENSDQLAVSVNIDGAGFPATPDITLKGIQVSPYNTAWAYDASGVASTLAGTPAEFASSVGDAGDPAGYATVHITIPDGHSTVALRVQLTNNQPTDDEGFALDDITLYGSGAAQEDTDSDGIPDDWETSYFLSPTGMVADADNDADGFSNYEEYLADTHPSNSASFLHIEWMDAESGLTFPASTGRVYTLQCTDQCGGTWSNLIQHVPATNSSMTLSDDAAGVAERFYRIEVSLP